MAEKRNTPPLTLLVTAPPNEKAKKRKPAEEKAAVKKALDKARGQTRVNIGPAFERWRGLKELKGFRSDAEVALFLLDSYEKDPPTSTPLRPPRRPPPPPPPDSAITLETTIKSESDRYEKDPPTSTPSRPPPPPDSAIKSEPLSDRDYDFSVALDQEVKEEETALQLLDARVPSIEIVVGIDEDNSTQNTDSDTEHSDDETGSPAEMSVDVPEEASEENSCYDDGDDEDYDPPFSIQFGGAYKTNRCLNRVQSTSKENTTHDAKEAAEQPAEAAERPVEAAERPAEAADRPAEAADRPAEAADRPAEAADRPAEAADRPAEAADRPAEAAERPAEAAERPAEAAERPAEAADRPAEAAERPAEAAERPAEAADRPAEAAERPAEADKIHNLTESSSTVLYRQDNWTQNTDSDTEHSDDEMGSPAEMSVDVPEEASEENSCYEDSDDEDYEPPFSIQFDGAYKTNRCLNQVQSTSKENTTHDAAEAAEQPAEADKIPNLTESSSTVRPRKRYICHTCGREFPRNPALKRHLVIHLGERPFKCFICGRGFTQDGNLKTHMKTHKGELHKWTLVEEKKKVEEPPVTAHICGKCGMNFPEKQQLDEHRETHKKPFECLVCGKTYAQVYSLKNHQRLHSEDTPYRCSVCGKICCTAQQLQKHEVIHTGKKNFHCDQCGKSFFHETRLKLHLKTHTGERPHLCSICGKSYATPQSFRDHLHVHTGERPYTCEKCGKGFRYAQDLRQHHRRIHDKKPKPPSRTPGRPLGRPKRQVPEGNDQ